MRLTCDEVEAALYAVHDLVYRRNLAGRSVPQEIKALYRRLLTASVDGSESDTAAEELDDEDLANSAGAAEILECTPRWVTEIHADLDGMKIGRNWVFRRQTVVDYAAAKGIGGDGYRVSTDGRGAVFAGAA